MTVLRTLFSSALLVALASHHAVSQHAVVFGGSNWTLQGDVVREEFRGRDALRFRNGAAVYDGPTFESGTVEFDFAAAGHRSFVGVGFRADDDFDNYEFFYVRPHNSGRFDAMQYTPEFNGIAAWQLYPEYNAQVDIPNDRWLHVRLVIDGARMDVYFDGAALPTLTVEHLRKGPGAGRLALVANFPANEPDGFYPNAFANVVVTPGPSGVPYPATESPPAGVIEAWAISPAIAAPPTPIRSAPEVPDAGWTVAAADRQGRVNVASLRGIPEGAARGTVLARVEIDARRPQTVPFHYGFSDEVSVFLNGRLLSSGNNTYLSRSARYLGVMTLDNDALYLPLQSGTNTLVLAVTEAFGGWGVIGRLDGLEGRVTAAVP